MLISTETLLLPANKSYDQMRLFGNYGSGICKISVLLALKRDICADMWIGGYLKILLTSIHVKKYTVEFLSCVYIHCLSPKSVYLCVERVSFDIKILVLLMFTW